MTSKIFFNPLNYNAMRISFLMTVMLVWTSFTFAQGPGFKGPEGPGPERPGQMDERVKAMKAAFLTSRLELTPEAAQQFWPIYNVMEAEEMAIREKYRPEKELSMLSDEEVEQLIQNGLRMEEELLSLKKVYLEKFRQVLEIRQIALLPRLEKEFNMQLVRRLQEKRGERPDRQPRQGQRDMRN